MTHSGALWKLKLCVSKVGKEGPGRDRRHSTLAAPPVGADLSMRARAWSRLAGSTPAGRTGRAARMAISWQERRGGGRGGEGGGRRRTDGRREGLYAVSLRTCGRGGGSSSGGSAVAVSRSFTSFNTDNWSLGPQQPQTDGHTYTQTDREGGENRRVLLSSLAVLQCGD